MAVCQGIFTKKIKLGGFIPTVTRWDLSVCPGFGVKEVFSGLVQMIEFVYVVLNEKVKSRCREKIFK